ncbi:MAG: GNAT family N-acetyltransferase [Pseudozobellia sp.]|nr:GNAT family N-acetyltransferase [Pseudozobellia sp.]|tara:strand:+ start:8113 stop:8574 length:462 start_codon:yes stop_codon:yes gene_type:complete
MNSYKVRTARIEDLETLLNFEQEIVRAERPFDPTIQKGDISYYDIRELILSPDAEVVVVEYNRDVVASGHARIREARHYLDHETYSYLGFMYTDPNHRGQGLNAKIVDALQAWTTKRGIKEIRLTVYNDNEAAVRAYEKKGFKKHIIEMRLTE